MNNNQEADNFRVVEKALVQGRRTIRVFGGPKGDFGKGTSLDPRAGLLDSVRAALREREAVSDAVVTRASAILQVLVASGVTGISTGLTYQGVIDPILFCYEAAQDPSVLERTVIAMGYGGKKARPSVRLPAYIIPAMEILRGLTTLNLPLPTVRIVSGQMCAVKVNGFGEGDLWESTLVNFALTKLFANRFYGDVAHKLMFDFDQPLEGVAMETARKLQSYAARHAKNCSYLGEALEAMRRQSMEHGGEEGMLLYAAMHSILLPDFTAGAFGTPWTARMHRNGVEEHTIITLGGPPERYFNGFRQFFTDNAHKILGAGVRFPRRVLRLLIEPGGVPVYYPKEAEPDFSQATVKNIAVDPDKGFGILRTDMALAGDFNLVEEHAGGVYALIGWVKDMADLLSWADGIHPGARELFAGKVLRSEDDPMDILSALEEMGNRVEDFTPRCREMHTAFQNGT